jgi:hypothetical protein
MCVNNNSEKNVFFAKSPTNLVVSKSSVNITKYNISQEERELLMAGYKIYHISAHRDTTILVVDNDKNEIYDISGEFKPSRIPKNLDDLITLVANSEMSDASVIEIQK